MTEVAERALEPGVGAPGEALRLEYIADPMQQPLSVRGRR